MDSQYRALMRRKLLEEMYDKLSPEDRRTFALMAMQDKDHEEIMQALQGLGRQVDADRHSWLADFGANVAGNAVFDGAVWLVSRLTKLIK